MLGYLFLALALICGVVKGYCGKKTSGKMACSSDSMLINAVRMLLCVFIGAIMVTLTSKWSLADFNSITILSSAVCGISMALFAISWILSVNRGAYMLVEVFLLCGTIIPIILCNLAFDEQIKPIHWFGIAMLIISAYIMCTYNKSIKPSLGIVEILLLVLCACSNGIVDFSQKLYVNLVENQNIASFNFLTYIFSTIVLFVFYLIFKRCEKDSSKIRKPKDIIKPIIVYVSIMAVCLFLHSFFKTNAANYLTATQIYPISQGGSLILSMLMSTLIFKEKINLKCIIGVILAFVSLLIINLF